MDGTSQRGRRRGALHGRSLVRFLISAKFSVVFLQGTALAAMGLSFVDEAGRPLPGVQVDMVTGRAVAIGHEPAQTPMFTFGAREQDHDAALQLKGPQF